MFNMIFTKILDILLLFSLQRYNISVIYAYNVVLFFLHSYNICAIYSCSVYTGTLVWLYMLTNVVIFGSDRVQQFYYLDLQCYAVMVYTGTTVELYVLTMLSCLVYTGTIVWLYMFTML